MAEDTEQNKINLDLDFENIVPWNGQQDTGRDVRLKLERNWQKVVDAFNSLISGGILNDQYLSKINPDTANEIITFLKGLLVGENGSGITVLEDGTSQAVVDRLYVKIKAYFDALEVKKKTYVGGEQIISPAGMKCIKVETLDNAYRCYMKAEEEGIEIENTFDVGLLAVCQECNIKVGVSLKAGNRFYWREVVAVGSDYIDLSITSCAADSDIPAVGDDIVGLGHASDIARQSAIIMSSVAETSPSIIFYQGINDFSLSGKEVIALEYDRSSGHAKVRIYGDTFIGSKDRSSYMEYTQEKGVDIKGTFHIGKGSTGASNLEDLPDFVSKSVQIGSVNLLLNSGFTGSFESEQLSESSSLESDSELYSSQLEHWTGIASVTDDAEAVSGKSAEIGSLSQSVSLIVKESYVISFKAKGENLAVSCGAFNVSVPVTAEYQRYEYKFVSDGGSVLLFGGTAKICDIQLERGTIATDWSYSPYDNDRTLAEFQTLKYLQAAIKDGATDIIGGLILSSIIKLGNYKDGVMQKVNAGISGIYNDDNDVAYWAGGSFEQAVRTVMKFKKDPSYEPSDDEWEELAKFVCTHGGDGIFRGFIYALGGYFRGRVETSVSGKRIVIDPEKQSVVMYDELGRETAVINYYGDVGETWTYGSVSLKRYNGEMTDTAMECFITPGNVIMMDKISKTETRMNSGFVSMVSTDGKNAEMTMSLSKRYESVQPGSEYSWRSVLTSNSWPTSSDDVGVGGVYNDNGTLKIKS